MNVSSYFFTTLLPYIKNGNIDDYGKYVQG